MSKKNLAVHDSLPFILLAVLIFLSIAAVYQIFSFYMFTAGAPSGSVTLTDWVYVQGGSYDAVAGDVSGWAYSKQSADIRKSAGTRYIRLQCTLPGNAGKTGTLLLYTRNNPVEVTVNGTMLYNGLTSSVPYTGSSVCSVDLPGGLNGAVLSIYVKTDYAFKLSARLAGTKAVSDAASVNKSLWVAGGLSIVLAGFFILIFSLLLGIRCKGLARLSVVGLMLMAAGGGIALFLLGRFARQINDPVFFKAQLAALMLVFACSLLLVFIITKNSCLPFILTLVVSFLYFTLFVLIGNETVSNLMIEAYPFIVLSFLIGETIVLTGALNEKIEHAGLMLTVCLVLSLSVMWDFAGFVYSLNPEGIGLGFCAAILFSVAFPAVIIKNAIYVNAVMKERSAQVDRDSVWIERVIQATARIFAKPDPEGFFIQTAKSLKTLIESDLAADGIDEPESKSVVSVCVALNTPEGYREIYNDGAIENCRYDSIEKNYRGGKADPVFFGTGCISLLLFERSDVLCVIYFEGMRNGISENLKNIIMIAYSNIVMALDNLKLKEDIVQTQQSVFTYLAEMSEAKSYETGIHLKRVSEYVRVLCTGLGMPPEEIKLVAAASVMHDVGKLVIPEEVIKKTGELTPGEFDAIKQHVVYGYNMMSKSSGRFMKAAAIICLQHHEKWDGNGYLRFKGEEIHPYARIVAVADVYDALLSERAYKHAWTIEDTNEYIIGQSGIQFAPEVVDVFQKSADRLSAIRVGMPNLQI